MSERLATALAEEGEQVQWDWTRLPQQEEFLTSTNTFTMFSGGFASGKTTVLCAKIIWLLIAFPNNLGYLGRLDGKALRASTMQTLYELFPDEYYTKNDQQGFLRLKPKYGGSKLIFGDFKDLTDLKNLPLGFFAIDQSEEVPKEVWDYLVGRLRRKMPKLTNDGKRQYSVMGVCPATRTRHQAQKLDTNCRLCGQKLPAYSERMTTVDGQRIRPWELLIYPTYGFGVCNPEGPSHWIYKDFPGLPGPHGAVSGPGMDGYQAWHASVYDGLNAGFVTERYVSDMETRYAAVPTMAQRYLHGIWVEAEGLVYPSFVRGLSMIHRHESRYDGKALIAHDAPMFEYIDHGMTAPTAVGWVLVENCDCGCGKENVWIIDEHYEAGRHPSYHAACILNKRTQAPWKLAGSYLDRQAFSKTLLGSKGTPRQDELYSVADEYAEHGIYLIPNQKDWDVGYNRITDLLAHDPLHKHPVSGEVNAPHLYVLSHCEHVIEEFETYKWKKRHGVESGYNDEPQDKNDHHMDGLNGLLASRPGGIAPRIASAVDNHDFVLESLEQDEVQAGLLTHMAW